MPAAEGSLGGSQDPPAEPGTDTGRRRPARLWKSAQKRKEQPQDGRTGGRTDRRGRGRLERGQPVLLSVGVLLGGFYFLAPLKAKR